MGMVGGGPGSFIGKFHVKAAQLDGQIELVCGAFDIDPANSKIQGQEYYLDPSRAYDTFQEMIAREKELPEDERIDFLSITTPNFVHYEPARLALENGFHVVSDKPLTNDTDDARKLVKLVEETGLIFAVTHAYTGYPMTRQARAMVSAGELGIIRLVQVEYVQGGKADESKPDPTTGSRSWRYDPAISGPSLVMGDIGTHAHNLLRFISGLEVTEVCAERGAIVPGRKVDDYAGALLRLGNGARGNFWVTQAAAGFENSLKIRVSGTKGSLEWWQELPQILTFKPLGVPVQTRTSNGPGILPLSARSSRMVAGHPEGFAEGFANIYKDAAEAVAFRIAGKEADPLALHFPTSADGLAGILFVDAVIRSSDNGSSWEKVF